MAPSRVSPGPTDATQGLTESQIASFHKDGYLIVPSALSPSTVDALLSTAHDLLQNFPLESHPMTKFSTGENDAHVGDDYFLTSGDQIRFFFEEGAFSPTTGQLTKPKHLAINKIGHALHELSPPFRDATLNATNARIARDLGFRDPRVLQSMVICKQPEIGGRVPSHQDSTFLYTDPPSAVGFWYALEDCTVENGCLSFAPGSHRRAPVRKRFVRVEGKGGTGFEDNDGKKWALDVEADAVDAGEEGEEKEQYVFGEVKAGTLVLIHGNVLHKSESNTSSKGRMIYTFHCIEGENRYDERNWLQPSKAGFSRLNDAL